MLSQSTLGVLLVVETTGLVATLSVLGIAIYAYRRANREIQYAREKAKEARLQLKNFLDSCSAALDETN